VRIQPPGDWQEDDWHDRCRNDFPRAVTALLRLAAQGDWVVSRWREALQVWSDERLAARSWRYLGEALASAPDNVIRELAHPLGWWLQKVAKVFTEHQEQFFSLIQTILEQSRTEQLEPDADVAFVSINHPVGFAADAVVSWWFRQGLKDGQGLNAEIRPIFTELCNSEIPIFRYGRFVLATHVIALFRVDQAWTADYLLPFFNWENFPEEAVAAWKGFLLSPRVYHPLLHTLKIPFLATAEHYDELGEYGTQYADVLTVAALEPRDVFSKQELAEATAALPPIGLESAAQMLVRMLEGAGEQRVEYWHNRIAPFLRYVWPKSRERLTPRISESFARLCVAAGEAFPDAFGMLRPWLQHLNHADFIVRLLDEGNLCQRFPNEALTFLDVIVGDELAWSPRQLHACLTAIEEAAPGLRDDNRFQRLRLLQRAHDAG
jgi:hypothetical protein